MSALNASSGCDAEYGYHCLGDFQDTLQLPQPDGIARARLRFRTADFVGPQVRARDSVEPRNVVWAQEIFNIGSYSRECFLGPENRSWGSES
jgi:hypothetical protein